MPATGSSDAGQISVAGRAGPANGVFVTTDYSAGTDANRPFHLAVFC